MSHGIVMIRQRVGGIIELLTSQAAAATSGETVATMAVADAILNSGKARKILPINMHARMRKLGLYIDYAFLGWSRSEKPFGGPSPGVLFSEGTFWCGESPIRKTPKRIVARDIGEE